MKVRFDARYITEVILGRTPEGELSFEHDDIDTGPIFEQASRSFDSAHDEVTVGDDLDVFTDTDVIMRDRKNAETDDYGYIAAINRRNGTNGSPVGAARNRIRLRKRSY